MFAKLRKINWEDVIIRTVKTFFQAFAGAFAIDRLTLSAGNGAELKTTLTEMALAALTAAICAVWNTLQSLVGQTEELSNDSDEKA